ncbi:MAG: ferredoxin [archaeon]
MAIKIVQEREKCIGCGACAAVCSKFWSLASDGKAEPKGAKAAGSNRELAIKDADLACNKSAAETCPINIIHIFDKDKKLI